MATMATMATMCCAHTGVACAQELREGMLLGDAQQDFISAYKEAHWKAEPPPQQQQGDGLEDEDAAFEAEEEEEARRRAEEAAQRAEEPRRARPPRGSLGCSRTADQSSTGSSKIASSAKNPSLCTRP